MELFGLGPGLASLHEQVRPEPTIVYDVLILGGGPAAMTSAIYAARKLLRCAVLTLDFGGQVGQTSDIENFLGFQTITGQELVAKFVEQVQAFNLPVAKGERVAQVVAIPEGFACRLASGETYRGRTVVLATGKRDRQLGVPGEERLVGRGVAYCATCDAPFFRDKTVLIAGGGNSAFTAALDLIKLATHVTLLNHSPGWKADPILQEQVRAGGAKVSFLDNHEVLAIQGDKRVSGVRIRDKRSGQEQSLTIDGVFVQIGLLPNSEPVSDLVGLNEFREVIVDCQCRTNRPGLFAAGDVTTVSHKQIIIAGGEGAKAALAASEYLVRHRLLGQ